MVLAYLCTKSNLDFAIAHCNFGLRGEESDADEKFVKEFSEQLKKKYFVIHFDTMGYVTKNKVSVQMSARELRYQWFAKLTQENNYKSIVMAHQADDNLETFLINLSRGTGINGLTGIPEQTDKIARPLLKFTREQVLAYAKKENLTWREDSSNQETKYLRNKIRHELVPMLKELHPTFLDNFQKTQEYLQETAEIAETHFVRLKQNLFKENKNNIAIKVTSLLELNPLKAHIYSLFKAYGFTAWNDILGLLHATSGKEVRSKTHRLLRDREYLLLQKIGQDGIRLYKIEENTTKIKEPIEISILQVGGVEKTSDSILYIDKKTLKYPLTLRKWKKGDYFYPLGMKGKKKLSKFYKDEKIDIFSKEKQWLLCSREDIVWVIGKRSDNRFRVTKNTKQIVKLTMYK